LFFSPSLASIAFNSNGAIFFNLRYFEQVFADELYPYLQTPPSSNPVVHKIVNFYFMVTCHELSHNSQSGHNEAFISVLERVAVQFMTPKELFLKEFSFENYS
jgi:hypothetical protein